jgi:hypothetical protein
MTIFNSTALLLGFNMAALAIPGSHWLPSILCAITCIGCVLYMVFEHGNLERSASCDRETLAKFYDRCGWKVLVD